MVKTLAQLKQEATKSAEFRGHRILWLDVEDGALGTCGCGEWVRVCLKPAANDIAIGGTAVALGCIFEQLEKGSVFNLPRGKSRTIEFPTFGMK